MITTTLPDLDELRQIDRLPMMDLYRIEIHHLSEIERAERQVFYERARQGDQEARSDLILHCLPYLFAKAFHIYDERRPIHIDLLDLVGEANMILLEKMDLALAKREPIPYLVMIATRHMEHYCTYCAPLIQRPFGLNTQALTSRQHYTSVESLDAPIMTEDGEVFPLDQLQSPASASIMGKDEAYFHARFSRLYEAVKQLAPAQQEAISRFYGLFQQPASTALELSKEWQVRPETIQVHKRRGFQKLRKMLASALEDMLREEVEEEI